MKREGKKKAAKYSIGGNEFMTHKQEIVLCYKFSSIYVKEVIP